MSNQLHYASSIGSGRTITDYLAWAEKTSRIEPNPALAGNMIIAESMLINKENFSQTLKSSLHLFPAAPEIKEAIEANEKKHEK